MNWKWPRLSIANIADAFGIVFIALTVEHNANTLSKWESSTVLAWFLSIGLDLAIAFSAYASCNAKLEWWPGRILSILWLVAMLVASYLLNTAHYEAYKADVWSYGLAAIFPASIALLGAIRGSLVKLDTRKIDDAEMLKDAKIELEKLLKHNAEYGKKVSDLQTALAISDKAIQDDRAAFEQHRQQLINHYDAKLAEADSINSQMLTELQAAHKQEVLALQEKLKTANAKPPANVSSIKSSTRSERASKAAAARWNKDKEKVG